MSSALFGFFVVALAALAPPLALSFAPYFKRTNKERVRRFHANFVLWVIFAPIVALAAYFSLTDATTKAALEIFDWWIYTSIGLACLILLLITLIVSYKNHDMQRTEAVRNFNAMALTEFSSFVLNWQQSLPIALSASRWRVLLGFSRLNLLLATSIEPRFKESTRSRTE